MCFCAIIKLRISDVMSEAGVCAHHCRLASLEVIKGSVPREDFPKHSPATSPAPAPPRAAAALVGLSAR